ncbi:CYTH domain-containing protein [Thiohalobacter sp. IOR34]|uniref:CYTH domain-containing protein n=1 Tax=Thiohalobacter sp. IOR34 TaxID=3057176 RepID=UPI0025AEF36C|nr:CYTH domain-containing protein [Thiohalobacter sp. IOR34]WJW76749.1 CYTH domain-containing protein [Thiohalobacter sp. IOR34]
MATEIERKFLVRSDAWRAEVIRSRRIRQGYLSQVTGPAAAPASVRVRIAGGQATLNIKSATLGIRRSEFEYPLPLADAEAMLDTLVQGALVEKTRHEVPRGEHIWEIDVFEGANAGLVVAEIELADEDEDFERPDWLGEEVSGDPRYYNVCLVDHPFRDW